MLNYSTDATVERSGGSAATLQTDTQESTSSSAYMMTRVTRSSTAAARKRTSAAPAALSRTLTNALAVSKGGITKKRKTTAANKSVLSENATNGETAPELARAMASPATDGAKAPSSRPASPTATNAPLVSPREHDNVTTLPVAGVAFPALHTGDILQQAQAHLLKVEPRLATLIEKHQCHIFSKEGLAEPIDPFQSLVSGIISQQVSGAAAKSIKAKFVNLFSPQLEEHGLTFPTPAMCLACDHATLRTAGLSGRKAEYVHSLAEKFENGSLSTQLLLTASNDECVKMLTEVRGLGVWSAEMFLLFSLKRMDVFSTGDLGIQRGMAAFMGRDISKIKTSGKGKWKYMSEADMLTHSEPYKPYRSLFMWYMWRATDVSVDAFQGESKKKKNK